jgi:predicted phage tail protein
VIPPRVKAAAKALELVGYGGSRERYVYNAEDAKAIERYLRDAFDKAMAAYGIIAPVQLGGMDPELVTKTVDAVLTEAEGEITAHSKRILNEMKAKVAELQKKAIAQAEQAALMVAEAEREAAKAGEQVIAQGEAEAEKVRDEVLKKVRSRIVADLGAAISTPTQPKPDSLEAILFGKG